MKDALKFSLTLFLISALAASLLSIVYALTETKIKQEKAQKEKEAILEVLSPIDKIHTQTKGDFTYYEASDKENRLLGYIFIVQTKGYSSDIKIVASLSTQGEVIAVKILEHNETPGIGSRIKEDAFLNKFKNKTGAQLHKIDAISGATISCSAVIRAVKEGAEKIFN